MRNFTLLFFLLCGFSAVGQHPLKFRVSLKDKPENRDLLEQPDRILSDRALVRRVHHEVWADSTDLPVAPSYLASLKELGFGIVCTSRWMNTVVVSAADSSRIGELQALPFVTGVKLVWKDNNYQASFFVKADEVTRKTGRNENMLAQLKVHNGDKLHQAGYRGEGMEIAVIDAGFLNTDRIDPILQRVKGTRDFVNPQGDIFATHPHGTNVLSVMAYPASSSYSGTAPNAGYWLLRSEDSSSEYPVEEDYWVAAAEYADSLGVDVINSSLGYYTFDDPTLNYSHADIDGHTAFITRGASMAASKGILVVNSAGNEREHPWRKLAFPADCPDILTVGAVTPDLQAASFTSVGFVSPYVKPDVSGVGAPSYYTDINGSLVAGSGTSFSSPAIAGLCACLWQSLPHLKNTEIIRLMQEMSPGFVSPDSLVGYGIPDVYRAYSVATSVSVPDSDYGVQIVPVDSAGGIWKVTGIPQVHTPVYLRIFNSSGAMVSQYRFTGNHYLFNLNHLDAGLYIVQVQGSALNYSQRLHLNHR